MAVPLVIPNAAMLKLRWANTGNQWLNVLGVVGNPTLPPIDATVAEAIFAAIKASTFMPAFLGCLAQSTIFQGISLRDISVANRFEFQSTGASTFGTSTTDALPLSVASVVTLRTALAGKSFRGRVYLSGFAELCNDATGRADTQSQVSSVDFINAVNTALQAHAMRLAVLSRPFAAKTIPQKIIPSRGGGVQAMTAAESRNNKWESQRRRTGRD